VELVLAEGGRSLVCALRGAPDLRVVDVLAQLQLVARRLDASFQVRAADDDLDRLLELVGLDGVIPVWLEPLGEAEPGEQPPASAEERVVEEVVDVHDPAS
jgi:hypothetical protein